MTTPYLIITNGTTTCTFLNGSSPQSYFVESDSWSPVITTLSRSDFGVVGPYDDVTEELDCIIRGSSSTDCYDKLDTIVRLLEQAERWSKGENVSVVLIKFAPGGSTVSSDSTPLQAVVLGRAEGDETSGVALAVEWDQASYTFMLPIRIRLRRRGLWLLSSETQTSAGAVSQTIHTITYSDTHPVYSPVDILLTGFDGTINTTLTTGYLLASNNGIGLVEAEGMATGAFTSVNDAANNASSTNILRYTPVNTNVNAAAMVNLPSNLRYFARRLHIFAVVRNNSATTNWFLTATLSTRSTNSVTTQRTIIDTTTTNPRVVYLGTAVTPINDTNGYSGFSQISINAQASAASGTLDIDCIAIAADNAMIIAIQGVTLTGYNNITVGAYPNYTTYTNPYVASTDAAYARGPISYSGSPTFFTTGQTFSAMWLTTNSTSWRFMTNTGISATRYKAYLTPR